MQFSLSTIILALSAVAAAAPTTNTVEKRACNNWSAKAAEMDAREIAAREVLCGPKRDETFSLMSKRSCDNWSAKAAELDAREVSERNVLCGPKREVEHLEALVAAPLSKRACNGWYGKAAELDARSLKLRAIACPPQA